MTTLFRLLFLSLAVLGAVVPASAATPTRVMKAHIALPDTNQPDTQWAASDTQVVYQLDDPLNHPPNCVSCGDPPFTDFQVHFYIADLRAPGAQLTVSTPRPLFTLSKGMHAALFAVVRGWLIYEPYSAARPPENGGPWTLIARNIATWAIKTRLKAQPSGEIKIMEDDDKIRKNNPESRSFVISCHCCI